MKRALALSVFSIVLAACGSKPDAPQNANAAASPAGPVNAVTANQMDANNLPAGLSPAPVNANTAPTPAPSDRPAAANRNSNANSQPAAAKKEPTSTPTPGIPSPEELRKMMQRSDVETDPNKPTKSSPMMKSSNRPLGGRMSANRPE